MAKQYAAIDGSLMVQPSNECFRSRANYGFVNQWVQLPAGCFLLVFNSNHSPKIHWC